MKNCFLFLTLLLMGVLTGCQRAKQTDIFQYYNYSTVDWERLDMLYYRPYSADWNEQIGQRIRSDFPPEIAAQYWHSLQNAKTDFHQRSLPLRAASSVVGEALDRTEAMFDTVFVRCVEQEYYMRLFVDVYNEVMPAAIDDLCRSMAAENTK